MEMAVGVWMKIGANVRRVTGRTKHYLGRIVDAVPERESEIPPPVRVEIEEGDGGFFLFRMDESGSAIADTWHLTLAEAKSQALFEFEIQEEDWVVVEN
jgi:hypothetical protein